MTENEFEYLAKKAIRDNRVSKGGRIATRANLLHLRDDLGNLLPKEVWLNDSVYFLMRPASIGVLNKLFPGAIWGRAADMKVNMELMMETMAEHIILDDGVISGDELMDALGTADMLALLIQKWGEISGLDMDAPAMNDAKEQLRIAVNDDPN